MIDEERLRTYGAMLPLNEREMLDIEEKIKTALIQIKVNKMTIGRLLYRAKKLVDPGKYEQWIKDTFGDELPLKSAGAYRKIFEVFCNDYGLELDDSYFKEFPIWFLIMVTQDQFPKEARRIMFEVPKEEQSQRIFRPIRHTNLREIEDKFGELKSGEITEGEFLYFVHSQRELGKEHFANNKIKARELNERSEIDKLGIGITSIQRGVRLCLKRFKTIQKANPMYDQQRERYYMGIDKAIRGMEKIRNRLEP